MKCRKLTTLFIVGTLSVAVTLSGCSSNRASLTNQGHVSVEKQGSEKIEILWTDVYEQDGQTWAYGILKQRGISAGAIKTHVDIQVLSPDGFIQYKTTTDDLFVPRNRVGRGSDWERFRIQLPEGLPKDSQIYMTVHSGIHKQIDKSS